ncbi:PKHG7 protein, partial [Polypterus senegalus]
MANKKGGPKESKTKATSKLRSASPSSRYGLSETDLDQMGESTDSSGPRSATSSPAESEKGSEGAIVSADVDSSPIGEDYLKLEKAGWSAASVTQLRGTGAAGTPASAESAASSTVQEGTFELSELKVLLAELTQDIKKSEKANEKATAKAHERLKQEMKQANEWLRQEIQRQLKGCVKRLQERRRSSFVVSLPGLDVSPGDLFVTDGVADLWNHSRLSDSKKSKRPVTKRSTDKALSEFVQMEHPDILIEECPSGSKRHEAVWELFTSECVYFLDQLMVLKEVFLSTLTTLQSSECLLDVDTWRLFANVKDLCLWCERNEQCKRLQLADLLVTPMQRFTRYPLLLKNIAKKCSSDEERKSLQSVVDLVEGSIEDLDGKVKWLDSFHKVQRLQELLIWSPVWECDKRPFIPDRSTGSELGTLRLQTNQELQNLFKEGCTLTVLDQPLSLDRVAVKSVDQLNASACGLRNAFMIMHHNRYQQCIGVFLLQAQSESMKKTWMTEIEKAATMLSSSEAWKSSDSKTFSWIESSQI